MTKFLKHNGEEHSITGWARKIGVHKVTLQQRLDRGWTIEQALTAPVCKPGERVQPVGLGSALKRYARRHHANERAFLKLLYRYIKSTTKHNSDLMAGIDMQSIGQPPAGTFKTPGVVGDFVEEPSDRSLSSTQDMT